MGRSKLEMRYRKEVRAQINTYKTRIKGIEKKAEELSVLCGVDVLFVSYSPDLEALHYWPKNPAHFNGILDRYKPATSCGGGVPSPPSNSPSQEELVSMSEKIAEVRHRICFLEAQNNSTGRTANASSSSNSAPQQSCEGTFVEADLQKHSAEKDKNECAVSAAAATATEDEDIYSTLEDLSDEDLMLKEDWDVSRWKNYFDSIINDVGGL